MHILSPLLITPLLRTIVCLSHIRDWRYSSRVCRTWMAKVMHFFRQITFLQVITGLPLSLGYAKRPHWQGFRNLQLFLYRNWKTLRILIINTPCLRLTSDFIMQLNRDSQGLHLHTYIKVEHNKEITTTTTKSFVKRKIAKSRRMTWFHSL